MYINRFHSFADFKFYNRKQKRSRGRSSTLRASQFFLYHPHHPHPSLVMLYLLASSRAAHLTKCKEQVGNIISHLVELGDITAEYMYMNSELDIVFIAMRLEEHIKK